MDLGGDLGGDNDLDLGMDIFSEGFNIDDDNPNGGDGDCDGKRNSMSQPNSPSGAQNGGRGGQSQQDAMFKYGQEEPGERIEILNQVRSIHSNKYRKSLSDLSHVLPFTSFHLNLSYAIQRAAMDPT